MKIKLSELKEAIKQAINEIGLDQALGANLLDGMMIGDDDEQDQASAIDLDKLLAYAKAIETICDGEYGNVFFDAKHNHVWVTIGDLNAFDDEMLQWGMRDAIKRNYDVPNEDILITVEHEANPPDDGNNWVEVK